MLLHQGVTHPVQFIARQQREHFPADIQRGPDLLTDAGTIVGEAQSFARALTNKPGNVINPPALADEAAKLAKQTKGLTCTIYAESSLQKKDGRHPCCRRSKKSHPQIPP
jgi:leucyl aminopeptidase